jgi:hypothetical protein
MVKSKSIMQNNGEIGVETHVEGNAQDVMFEIISAIRSFRRALANYSQKEEMWQEFGEYVKRLLDKDLTEEDNDEDYEEEN